MVNRLRRDPTLLKEYNAIIEEQIKQGIVERVPVEEENNSATHYIPHHGVVRNDRDTTKLRIVFDGSAKEKNNERSLNDHLLNGSNFIPPIFDVLVKLRSHATGLTGHCNIDIFACKLLLGHVTDTSCIVFFDNEFENERT